MNNDRRQQRIEKGLCARCGKRPPDEGVQLCGPCRAYHKNYAAKEWEAAEGRQKRQQRLRTWQKNNPDRVREREKKRYHAHRTQVLDHYGHRCRCCGEANDAFLTVDHVNGDGASDRANFYYRIVKQGFPKNLQTLCWNCNLAKHIYGRCPHQPGIAT